ncbi:MAG: DUF1549 domain-containing protein [Pirellulales bacterium]
MRRLIVIIACGVLIPQIAAAGEGVNYLGQIKPILAARCYPCHSALRQQSGLRLDTAALAIAGGDSGAAIQPGKSADSLLVEMITGASGVRMPPEDEGEALKEAQIALIKKWIDEGARAPAEPTPPDPRDHWAYQPPVRPAVPEVANAAWVRNSVDAFIVAQHESHGVVPVQPADKAVLLRRVYLDLVGLPPTRAELQDFLADDSPDAYERVVDHLLDSPQYGERWARHWMDVWRYSDWSGYKEEIRNSARHIWRWRDWIVESLNADQGYDRMVQEMLAGDELAPTDPDTLRATGFLARNWYKFNRNTWLEGTIEHTAKAFLGVTMNCCRCHDHKYDPISQVEYYELRAIFEPHDLRTDRVPGQPDVVKDGLARVCDLRPDAPTYVFERGDEKRPDKSEPIEPGVPEVIGGQLQITPVELPLEAFYPATRDFALQEDLERAAGTVSDREAALTKSQQEVAAAQKKGEAIVDAVAAAELAMKQLATARAAHASLTARIAAEKAKYGLSKGTDAAQLATTAVKAERELALCQAQEQQLAAAQELPRAQAARKPDNEATRAAVAAAEKKLADAASAIATAHAALAQPAAEYQPLGEKSPQMSTGRRLAFARWITDRANPLAARVAINHIWLRHFGAPLVDNMFDLGLRSPLARNQPLLDWLAVELMDHNWQMKHIHRLLVTSNVYRMTSGAQTASAANLELDRDNHFLWRMNTRRLEAELVRDALFFTAGNLDLTRGGADLDRKAALTTPRRSLYFRHAYEKEVRFLQLFDGPSVNECYRRSESVVPQQALALANSEVSVNQSRLLARKLSKTAAQDSPADDGFIQLAFQQILCREPSPAELNECRSFLTAQTELLHDPKKLTQFAGGAKTTVPPSTDPQQRARENLTHMLYNHNDFVTIR